MKKIFLLLSLLLLFQFAYAQDLSTQENLSLPENSIFCYTFLSPEYLDIFCIEKDSPNSLFRNLPTSIQYKLNATSTPINAISNISYNEIGKPTVVTMLNGVTSTSNYDVDKMFRLTNKVSSKNGATTTLQNLTYTYDNVGNILTLVDSSNSSTSKAISYTYDDLYRLTNATASTTATGTLIYSNNYSYNILGNLLTTGTTTYNYQALTQE